MASYCWEGQHHIGELIIFIPPDSVVPQKLIDALKLEYLREHNGRLRTLKLRGVISQGLVISFSQLVEAGLVDAIQLEPHYVRVDGTFKNLLCGEYKEGDDVGKSLGIKKYEVHRNL